MKLVARLTPLLAAAAGVALLGGCSITYQSSASLQTPGEQAMAICGLGIIQTSDGPRPAISASPMPAEAYRTYTDCVQSLTHDQQARAEKAASHPDSGTQASQADQSATK